MQDKHYGTRRRAYYSCAPRLYAKRSSVPCRVSKSGAERAAKTNPCMSRIKSKRRRNHAPAVRDSRLIIHIRSTVRRTGLKALGGDLDVDCKTIRRKADEPTLPSIA